MVTGFAHLVGKLIWNILVGFICASLVFMTYKANQPMTVTEAPKGMSYVEFMQDRLDAAKTVKPSQCGWGMMLSLAAIGPIYSVVYTAVGVIADGVIDPHNLGACLRVADGAGAALQQVIDGDGRVERLRPGAAGQEAIAERQRASCAFHFFCFFC